MQYASLSAVLKCSILESVFFRGGYLSECLFDEEFKKEVNKYLLDIENDNIPENNTDDKENSNTYLNYDISIDGVESVLQQLQNNKSPGPDRIAQTRWRRTHKSNTQNVSEILGRGYSTHTMEISRSEISSKKRKKELP